MGDELVLGLAFLGCGLIVVAVLMLMWIELRVSAFGHQLSFVWKLVRGNISLIQVYAGIIGRKSLVCCWYWFFFAGVLLGFIAVLTDLLRSSP